MIIKINEVLNSLPLVFSLYLLRWFFIAKLVSNSVSKIN